MSFDFGLTLPDTLDYQRRAGSYWGDVQTRAQQEWNDRRLRDTADREGRMQRDLGRGNLDAYAQRRGQFNNHNSVLYGLQRGDQTPYMMPNSTTTAATATPQNTNTAAPTAGLTTELAGGPSVKASGATKQWRQEQVGSPTSTPNTQGDANFEPVQNLSALTPEQRRAHEDYIRSHYSGIGSAARRESTARRASEVGLAYDMHGQLLRRRTEENSPGTALGTFVGQRGAQIEGRPAVSETADLQNQGATNGTTNSTGSTTTPGEVYLGTNDTSGPLQMTPDMELMDMSIQDSMRNAEIYARYGRNDLAEQSMNQALAGQAALHQQENILLLRATAEGNMTAAARLVERLNGRPPNTARFVPTPEDRTRFVLMVRGSDGVERSAYETPITRSELFSSFETAVDAVGSAQRRAASAAIDNNIRDNQTRIYVADRDFQARVLATLTTAETARWEAIQRRVTEAGGQMHVATDNDGGVYAIYPEYNQDGSIEWIKEHIHVGDVQTPGTNGTTTAQGLVSDRVTGTGNTTARAN